MSKHLSEQSKRKESAKRISRRAVIIAIILIMLLGVGAYAWYVRSARGSIKGIRVMIADEEAPELLIGNKDVVGTSDTLTLDAGTKTLEPCTSDDGRLFYDEDGNYADEAACVFKEQFSIAGTEEFGNVTITSVDVEGADDAISEALRVSVEYPLNSKDVAIFAPVGEHEGYVDEAVFDTGVGTTATNGVVRVWIDGADENCTLDNAVVADDEIAVDVNFEVIENG